MGGLKGKFQNLEIGKLYFVLITYIFVADNCLKENKNIDICKSKLHDKNNMRVWTKEIQVYYCIQMIQPSTWMNLEITLQNKISQTKKKVHDSIYVIF